MTASPPFVATAPLRRRAWWLLVGLHVPFIVFTVAQAGLRLAVPEFPLIRHEPIATALVLIAGLLQLRHSLAAAAGLRPAYWRLTLLLLVAIAWVPAPLFGARWATLQWFVLASFAMLLPGRIAVIATIVSALGHDLWYAQLDLGPGSNFLTHVWAFAYWGALEFMGAVALYGSTRLVRLLDELRDARAELAELAIGRERLRISRDLHDLLGQSLSAVSLKGDLAMGLLERNEVPPAVAEIESLVAIARSALHDVLDVAHREPPIALASEIERAADLLSSTGTETRVDIGVDDLPPPVEELFAWALREGVTNVLRHSSATTCMIRIARNAGIVRLEIINDGAMPVSTGGNGLSGLAARAAALSGSATGRALGNGSYQLTVEVPEVAP